MTQKDFLVVLHLTVQQDCLVQREALCLDIIINTVFIYNNIFINMTII